MPNPLDFVNPITQLLGAGASLLGIKKTTDANSANLAFQRDALDYQKGVDAFNMDLANRQFDAQMALNERNSITGQTAEMARNGLNPLTGSNFANGSGSVSGSQIASGAQPLSMSNDFSSLSQLGAQLSSFAQSGFQRKSAEKMNKAGLDNAMQIAKMEDANRKKQLELEEAKNNAELKHWKALNDYEEKNGVPYEHRSAFADTVTSVASLINNTLAGKSSLSDIPGSFDSVTGTSFASGNLFGDANASGNKDWTESEIKAMYNEVQGSRQEKYNEIHKRTGLDITKIRKMTGTY